MLEINSVKHFEMAGTYREYHNNGQLKIDGFYKLSLDTGTQDAMLQIDPKTKKQVVKTTRGEIPHAQQAGTWYYYKENGEILKQEEFK
jgi:antitoxin component YwqK of YwqJK toxin-antitoxin module